MSKAQQWQFELYARIQKAKDTFSIFYLDLPWMSTLGQLPGFCQAFQTVARCWFLFIYSSPPAKVQPGGSIALLWGWCHSYSVSRDRCVEDRVCHERGHGQRKRLYCTAALKASSVRSHTVAFTSQSVCIYKEHDVWGCCRVVCYITVIVLWCCSA